MKKAKPKFIATVGFDDAFQKRIGIYKLKANGKDLVLPAIAHVNLTGIDGKTFSVAYDRALAFAALLNTGEL